MNQTQSELNSMALYINSSIRIQADGMLVLGRGQVE